MISAGESFLRRFHDSAPGGSPRAFAGGRLPDGRDTYDWLADHASPGERVLDLCCGDGFLLAKLAERGVHGVGVDLSQGELEAARARGLSELHLARAQELPLADASVDGVVCSWALMLLDDLPGVLDELRRVLRPDGWLAAVIGAPPPDRPDNRYRVVLDALRRHPQPDAVSLGDARSRDPDALTTLLEERGYDRVSTEVAPYDLTGPAEAVTELGLGMYNPAWMRPEDREALREELMVALGPGVHPCWLGVMLVSCQVR
ncbi:MAG: methyltransferase domain-containing protein [Alphaproteobacteria bacterium]|nr:methyltransferase domain-containing protein [Alphaproteobacteria bacterium]